ncbi:heavy-metal-associated domain-containing protein [Roseiconus lacunae]|uniref:Heavy-metal-associated domain-containing protein n=1 Tax=Roseiconus lacunae TaxID=2605694 RepID=A0ABT7PC52_9BACT|nr:heavy-metal-associated domain-containing protein [Roseiconus lacunae]MCD0463493.1 heavy-metal-associated domain-containing protein [Roseiconus lacunae]MDM4014057.1 heavy-metal-associated domain-containing protein [Roseiconus lacunae]
MRAIAYVTAIVVAAAIMFFIIQSPEEATSTPEQQAASSVAPEVDVNTASLTLNVPDMHCPFACYPNVKKTLEGRDDVVSVELVPQKEEGVIDTPQVVVQYKDGFVVDNAIAQLGELGFAGSTVVE